jgi:hypothetical protein
MNTTLYNNLLYILHVSEKFGYTCSRHRADLQDVEQPVFRESTGVAEVEAYSQLSPRCVAR